MKHAEGILTSLQGSLMEQMLLNQCLVFYCAANPCKKHYEPLIQWLVLGYTLVCFNFFFARVWTLESYAKVIAQTVMELNQGWCISGNTYDTLVTIDVLTGTAD